jgi:tetratricopeptide (TPR) repeat protein
MAETLLTVVLALALVPLSLVLVTSLAYSRGWWRLLRPLGRAAPFLVGPGYGGMMAFQNEISGLRELGRLEEAVALAKRRLRELGVPAQNRNTAIDLLISAGAYEAALAAEPTSRMPRGAQEAMGMALAQVNLAEAEYNLGRWDAAEARLRPLDLSCWLFPISRAGLLQQRAWIAAHRGHGARAAELCAQARVNWLPRMYQAEYHFTRAAASLAGGRCDEADRALADAERVAIRLSSRRNLLFLRARVAAVRGDWPRAEALCREAAGHAFRGQGGGGLLLWAEALERLGRPAEATEALRLVAERDPESESARDAAERLTARS